MSDTTNTIENIAEEPTTAQSVEQIPTDTEPAPEIEPESFSAEYVKTLREEAASQRVKARRTDEANARLLQALAQADGRLIEAGELAFTSDLIDDDGIVDGGKVTAAIDALIAAKPYLSSRRPTMPIAQGVQTQLPETPGLFTLIRERA
jgi:hypothetical protein